MKLPKSLIAAVALGIAVGGLTTACNSTKTTTCTTTVESKTDMNTHTTSDQHQVKPNRKDPCPACGRG